MRIRHLCIDDRLARRAGALAGFAACALFAAGASAQASPAHPALALKRANRAAYDAPAVLAALPSAESICGANDLQFVNAYTGGLGPSAAFVQAHKAATGAMAASASAGKYCSGTLISRELFLTASHCVGATTVGHVVAFNFELAAGAGSAPLTESAFPIAEIVHDDDVLDFALVRLSGSPGSLFPWTAVNSLPHPDGNPITIIQHPNGEPKQVEAGTITSQTTTSFFYGNVDTQPGSSGSGILNQAGELIGVHTNGGCGPSSGENSGTKISQAVLRSAALAAASGRTPSFLAGRFNGDNRADLVQAFEGWGSLPLCASAAPRGTLLCSNNAATMYDFGTSEQLFLRGDFNGDSRDDVIQTFSRWGSIPTCYSTASGWSCANHPATMYDWDSAEQNFLVADVDADKRSDVLQTYRRWSSIPVCKSTGSGYACSNPPATIYDSGSTEQEFLVADVDADGDGDVLQTYRGWGSIPICKYSGATWSCSNPAATIYNSGSSEQQFLVGDFNGDKKDDVIQTYRGWGSIPRCLSTGSGWTCNNPAATIYNSGSSEQRFLVGDFNGDGWDDVAQVFRGWSSIPVCLATSAGWSCGNWPATIYDWGSSEQSFTVADIDGDGRDDIVQTYRKWGSYPTCFSNGSGWDCINSPASIYDAGP